MIISSSPQWGEDFHESTDRNTLNTIRLKLFLQKKINNKRWDKSANKMCILNFWLFAISIKFLCSGVLCFCSIQASRHLRPHTNMGSFLINFPSWSPNQIMSYRGEKVIKKTENNEVLEEATYCCYDSPTRFALFVYASMVVCSCAIWCDRSIKNR